MMFFRKLLSVLTLPVVLLTLLTSPKPASSEGVELVDSKCKVLEEAIFMGQGITTDGEYYYTSGSITFLNLTVITKYDMDEMELVDINFMALPASLIKRGFNHIGGISYYNGKIYASVEGEPDDKYIAGIAVYDPKTLKATGDFYDLPFEEFDDGVPWCAVDPETGYLYCSKWSDAKKLLVYDTNDRMEFVREIEISGVDRLHRIQGGEFYNGTLYLSEDIEDNGTFKNILAVNVHTGDVTLAFERNVGGENIEAEGLTIYPTEDGALFHVLDYNRVIGVFVNHYAIEGIQ